MAELTGVTFRPDLSPRLVILDDPATEIILQDLHDTIIAWQDRPPNHDYDVMIQSAGKEDIGGGVAVGITATFQNAQLMAKSRVAVISGGTVTTGDALGLQLTDAAGDFLSTVSRGDLVWNQTDGSKGTVLEVIDNFNLTVDVLAGGTLDQFTSADVYEIFDVVLVNITGGNLVAVDEFGAPMAPVLPSFGTQIVRALSSSSTLVTAGGLTPTQQEIRDAMTIAPTGAGVSGSVDRKLDLLGYADGVWVDPNNGTAGTVLGVNGLRGNPVDTLADAITLAAAAGISTYQLVTGSFTFAQGLTESSFVGHAEVEVNLGGQSVNESRFENCLLKGVGTGTVNIVRGGIEDVSGLVILAQSAGYFGTNTLGVGVSTFDDCYSRQPGQGSPTCNFNGAGTTANFRGYKGGLTLEDMNDVTNVVTVDFLSGQLTIASSCSDGTREVRGDFALTNNETGGTTRLPTLMAEIWKRVGLDPASPLATSDTQVTVGGITLNITDVAGVITLTRA